MNIFLQQLRELKQERIRILLTVFAIVWGTMSITILLAFGESVTEAIERGFHGLGDGIVLMAPRVTSRTYGGFPQGRRIRFTLEDADLIREQVPAVADVAAEYQGTWRNVTWGEKTLNVRIIGVDPSYRDLRSCYPRPGGRFFNRRDMEEQRRVVFLGFEAKKKFFGDRNAVGATIRIQRIPFTVIGVMREKTQLSTYQGEDRELMIIPSTTFKAFTGSRYISQVIYLPKPEENRAAVLAEVRKTFAARHSFDPDDPMALDVFDVKEVSDIYINIFVGMRIFLFVIGLLTLIVAGVGVVNIMYVLVKDRTQEVGIKMAVGAKPKHILRHHLMEGLVIVFLGGALGVLFSAILLFLFRSIPLEHEAFDYIGRPELSLLTVLIVTAVLGFVGFLAGYFPARRAASVDPVEALLHE